MLTKKEMDYLSEIQTTNPEIYSFINHMITDTKHDIKVACHDICNIISLVFGNFQLLELTNPQLSEQPRWIQMNDDLRFLINSMESISYFRYADKVILSSVNIHSYINETMSSFVSAPLYAGLNFTIHNEAKDTTLKLDADKTKFVMESIITNIAEQTPESNVIIHIQKDTENLYINISDDTTFIPHEIRDTIFQPFVTDKQNHLGLSLASSYKIMLAHNGLLEYIPNLDAGSTFSLRFPLT